MKFRTSLESVGQESIHQKTNKKVNLLHQALLITQWVQQFDTTNVNDCFDNDFNHTPSQIHQFEMMMNDDIKKIDNMKLSPNNTFLNDQVKNVS